MDLKDITFVIPTNKDVVRTLESIPKECSVIIRRDDTRGKARNEGVHQSRTGWIVFVDDDIKFDKIFLDYVMKLVDKKLIVGLQGYTPSVWLISRFMIFHKSVFEDVGDLKEVQHGEETEWCIRASKKGYKLLGVPRESVYHYPHEKSKFKGDFKTMLWLLYLHPDLIIRAIKRVVIKVRKSNYDDKDYE